MSLRGLLKGSQLRGSEEVLHLLLKMSVWISISASTSLRLIRFRLGTFFEPDQHLSHEEADASSLNPVDYWVW